MGSDGGCLQPNGCYLNGLLPKKSALQPRGLDMERWMRAEERTAELIARIQPDQLSWESRNAVASYVQRLITQCIPCVVFIYGSVPLKTYLPDGDIDLTVFGEDRHLDDNFAAQVRDRLEKEGKNENAEYRIKEVRLINAEVKVIKCLVDDIVVDISFSQLGGLCTLCFLEQVDRHINQNHLFKRSIILIKAWCYYESRLLGAYYGLISTYGLETLILYIFHVFNNSFAGPLEVLYRFLEFFSSFDWDNFCISLQGPVPIRSLPDMTADPPRKDGGALFLSRSFLDTCSFYFSVSPSPPEIENQFVSKHFNIIDFLRTNNNLGRSVARGNFFRIRSAFALGAQRLARLLDCPKENVVTELNRFFLNTWDTNGKAPRPDTRIVHTYEYVNQFQMETGEEVGDHGFWVYGTSSLIRRNPANGLFCSEYRERKQAPASAGHANACFHSVGKYGGGKEFSRDGSLLMHNNSFDERFKKASTRDHKPVIDYRQRESHGKDGIPFSNAETRIPPTEAIQVPFTCTPTNYLCRTPFWVPITSILLHPCSSQTAMHNSYLFPDTLLPAGPDGSCVTYITKCQGKGAINLSFSQSGSTLNTTGSVCGPDNSHESKECTSDILSGDWSSHLSNMLYAQSRNSPFDGSYFCHPSIPPPQYLESELLSGDPGRPSSQAVNCCALPETAVMHRTRYHSNETSHTGGYQHYPKGIPGYGMGIGTCAPNLSCRDFQSSSSRKQKGKYRYQKEQHGDEENNSNFNSKPRFAGRAQHWENPNTRLDNAAGRNDRVHMQWKPLAKQPPLPDQPSSRRVQGSLII